MLKTLAIVLTLLTPLVVAAQPHDERLSDPAQEQRARDISRELRCLVCQNQSIEDSNAPLARDLRRIVRERVAAGESDPVILDYLVARYGEWVLLRPRFNRQNLLLWLGPFLFLGAGAMIILLLYRRQRFSARRTAVQPLSPEERKRLSELQDEDGKRESP